MTSGPTQNYEDAHLGRWQPHPVLAALVRAVAIVLPVVFALAFGLAAAHWLPASRLGVNRWVWVACEVVLSLLVLRGATHLAKRLVPLAGLLKLALYFPDNAPSRLAVALRHHSPDALRAKIAAPANPLRRLTEERDHADRLLEMIAAIAAHDSLTAGHSERVQAYAALVGKELGLSGQDAAKLSWAALLHDVGKLAVPTEILSKSTRPTDEEWSVLATHPHAGREIAAPLADWLGPWLDAIDQHHERWDGGGYPLGLAGRQISLGARIVAVVDAYDVITSARAYKAPLTASAARAELARCAGTQFDPEVVRAMLAVGLGKLRTIAGPISAISAVPGLGATPLSGFTAISSAVGSVGAAVVATVAGAALGLVGPGALPSDAATSITGEGIVASRQADASTSGPAKVDPASGATMPTAAPGSSPTTPGTDPSEPSASSADAATPGASAMASSPAGSSPASTPATTPAPTAGTPAAPASGTAPATAAPTTPPTTAPTSVPTATPSPIAAPTPAPTPTGTNACTWARNGWMPLPNTDLKGCDLRGVTLTGNFTKVDLTGARLDNAILTGIDLTDAVLDSASFVDATITSSNLTHVSLKDTNLTGATIRGSVLDKATIERSTFAGAVVTDTAFLNAKITKSTAVLAHFTRDSFVGAEVNDGFLAPASVTDCTF